ncbi:uncharacterized protein LOC143024719 isoform X2 [Oratosquilla oratoria]
MCHAFLCPKKKMAQAVTLTIAQAFSLAYEGWKMSQKNNNEIYGHEEVPAQVMMGPADGKPQFSSASYNRSHSTPSSRSSSPIPIRADLGSPEGKNKSYQSSQVLLIDLDKDCNSEEDVKLSSTNSTNSTAHKDSDKETIPDKSLKGVLNPRRLAVLEQDLDQINDEFSRLAMARGDKGPQLPGTSPHAWVDLDHAASTAPLPVSPSKNGYLLSANSAQDDWNWSQWGQSPPSDGGISYSRSPNTAFLNSCQSPPSNRPFGFFTSRDPFCAHSPPDSGLGEATFDPFGLCQSPPDPFTVAHSPTDPFNMSSQSPPDPFSVSQSPPDPFNAPQCSPDPFTVSKSPPDPFTVSKSPPDPFTVSKSPPDPFTVSKSPPDPFTVSKSPPDPFTVSKSPPDPFTVSKSPPDPFTVSKSPPDPFTVSKSPPDPFTVSQSPPDPFTVSQSPPDPFTVSQSPPDPFTVSQSPPDPFTVSQSPPDPFTVSQSPSDPFTVSQSPSDPFTVKKQENSVKANQNHDVFNPIHVVDPFTPVKSSSMPSSSTQQSDSSTKRVSTDQEESVGKLKSVPSITVTGCGGARSPWSSNGAFDNSDVICS